MVLRWVSILEHPFEQLSEQHSTDIRSGINIEAFHANCNAVENDDTVVP